MVTRLSGLDAWSLHTQSPTTPAHTLALVIIDASDRLSHERLHDLLAAALPKLARFRSRLVSKPLGLGQPVWAEIDDYDPSAQIHRATVQEPGQRREFAALIAELNGGRPECSDRLWEAWSINGLSGGRWALAVRMSPALNEGGVGAASLWPRLLVSGPRANAATRQPTEPTEPSLGSTPSWGELLADAAAEIVGNQLTGAWLTAETMPDLVQALRARLPGEPARRRSPARAAALSPPVPDTVFNAPLTNRRAVAFASIRLAEVKTVSKAFGGSITNVVLAACALSLREWLQRHDTVPKEPLLMRIPFELPAAHRLRTGTVRDVGRLRIPVHLQDPVQILANLHTATERLNTLRGDHHESDSVGVDFAAIAPLIPPTLARVGMQLLTRSGLRHRLTPRCHGSISYAGVDPKLAYCAGAKIVGIHTVAPLSERSGLSITLTAHGGQLDMSVCACPDNVPAVDDIASGIAHSVDVLMAAARKSPRGQGRSVVSEMTSHRRR